MTEWGVATNGYWKLGVDFVVVEETSDYTDIRADVKIWTKYATWEGSNSLTISGDWSYSGSTYAFSVTTNSAWSTNNIALIWQGQKRFTKDHKGYDVELSARLTSVNYPNTGYVETVYASEYIEPEPYDSPVDPTNFVATRQSDSYISFTWTNNSPGSSSRPYQNLEITAVDENDPKKNWFSVAWLNVRSSYIWKGAKPDKKYKFAIKAYNRDEHSRAAYSNYVYTTPSAPSQPTHNNVRVTGTTEPKTHSVDLAWTYPSGRTQSVTSYILSWNGPTTGSVASTTRYATASGLIAGGTYSFSVKAANTGDGNDVVYGPSSILLSITIPSPPQTAPVLTVETPFISGQIEPRTSSVVLSWNAVSGATSYAIVSGSMTVTTSATTITISDIPAGAKRSFVVYPSNDVGLGAPSQSVMVATAGLPGPPSIGKFVPIPEGIDVSIGPGTPNGSSITGYQYRVVTSEDQEIIPWTAVPSMSFVITGVSSGTTYVIYVRSINGVGTGVQTAYLSSDAAGGKIAVYNGSDFIYRYIRTNAGIAPVRVYNGSQWVLTPF